MPNLRIKKKILLFFQCLGKNICKLLICGNKTGTNISENNDITNKMTYFNVFGYIMKNWIMRNELKRKICSENLTSRETKNSLVSISYKRHPFFPYRYPTKVHLLLWESNLSPNLPCL